MISLCKLKHKNEKEKEGHRAVDPKVEWWFHGSIPTKNKEIFEFRAIYIHIPICLMILGLVPSPSPPHFFNQGPNGKQQTSATARSGHRETATFCKQYKRRLSSVNHRSSAPRRVNCQKACNTLYQIVTDMYDMI